MTAMQFICQAALRTPDAAPAGNKSRRYEPPELGQRVGICWLCGEPTQHGHLRRKVIKPTFTEAPIARAPWSDIACEYCAWGLSYWSLRLYSILATQNGLCHPTRADWRTILLDPPEPPFLACVALSGQKWLHIWASIAYSRDRFPIMIETTPMQLDRHALAAALKPVEALYAGFTKAEIASGDYQSHRIQIFGMDRWEAQEAFVQPLRGSRLFALALLVAQRKEDGVANAG